MPDASGNFKGQGWSAKREASWERIFGKREAGGGRNFWDDPELPEPLATRPKAAPGLTDSAPQISAKR